MVDSNAKLHSFKDRINKYSYLYLSSFFWVVFISQILSLVVPIDFKINLLFALLGIFFGLYYLFDIRKFVLMDVIVLVYMAYILFNGFSIDYLNHWKYLYRAIVVQFAWIFFYFIGRKTYYSTELIIKNMQKPLIFCMICGLVFFIYPPSWYMQMKMEQLSFGYTEKDTFETFRLSSFWGHPYVISYAVFIYYTYIINKLFSQGSNKMLVLQVLICLIVLLLAQMRVAILMFLVAFVYHVLVYTGKKIKKFIFTILLTIALSSSLVYVFYSYIPVPVQEYVESRILGLTEEEEMTGRFEHTGGGISVANELWGNGFGRYDYEARQQGKFAIVDNEYQNHYAELGYIGLFFLISILLLSIVRFFWSPSLHIEFLLLVFSIIACIGASVFSNHHQYAYFFWFCIGRLWNSKYIKIIKRKNKRISRLKNSFRQKRHLKKNECFPREVFVNTEKPLCMHEAFTN